ncbi:MAG: M28 family peptidase, partial [Victivallaceae bacterium]|nr:M28 family peptidase [Victivallaceae bacterium]
HTDFQREDLSYLTGRAVIYYGVNFPSGKDYRRMMEARPAFLMMVDTRFVSATTLADGLFPAYVKAFGALPCVSVAAFDSWEWVRKKASKARLCVAGGAVPSQSCNVVAELPGYAPDGRIIYFGSHIDTQANCPGADDNAAACALLLEFARILSETEHKRTIRFLSFGTEEQLSVGSCAYLAAHKDEISKGGFCFNFDGAGTAVGWTVLRVSAPVPLRDKIRSVFQARNIYYLENRIPKPFNDFFPFSASGIGGFSGERYNCETKLNYHHRRDDVIANLSMDILAGFAGAAAEIAAFLADADDVSPYLGVDPDYAGEVKARWEETFIGKNIGK